MHVVVLYAFTLNPADLSWAGLETLGPCAIYDRTSSAETVIISKGANYVVCTV